MDTEELIKKAMTNMVGDYTNENRASTYALIAIAQELKRANDITINIHKAMLDLQDEQFADAARGTQF